MFLRALCLAIIVTVFSASLALASEFDGLSVAQIRAHPDFVASDYSLSAAKNSGAADAEHIYWWIGYIPTGDKRVYFDSFGEALTCVEWKETGEWVPEWVVGALDKLVAGGYIVIDPNKEPEKK
jgi:hypothetical protein